MTVKRCILLLALSLPTTLVAALHVPNKSITRAHGSASKATALFARGGSIAPPLPPKRSVSTPEDPPDTTSADITITISNGGLADQYDNIIPAGDASIPNEVFNVIKSIVGAGVLGLPAGIASFGNAPTAVIPAMILLVTIGALSAYGFSLIGIVCAKTKSTSYRQAWSRSVGEATAWMPALACLLVTACSVLTYSMILADTVPSVIRTVTGFTVGRTYALLGMTTFILTPLCLLKNLKSLAPFSLVGILGMVYTATAMAARYLRGSYMAPNGKLLADLAVHLQPSFGAAGYKAVFSSNTAILVSMLSTAYMAHYNAPKFYWELRDTSVKRYNRVVGLSFAGAILLMAATAATGFLTFGGACSSLILNNYAANDSLMSLSRAAVTVSLMFSYPLAFGGVAEGLLDLLKVPTEKRLKFATPLTLGLLALITSAAFVLKDIGVILALGGATWGTCVIYLFPTFMLYKAAQKDGPDSDLRPMVPRAIGTGVLGLCMGLIGCAQLFR